MANDLRLQVVLDLVNAASGPLRNITKSSAEAAKTLKATRDTLQQLNQQQKNIAAFREVKKGLQSTSSELDAARERVRELARQFSGVEQPTKAMTREFESAKKHAAKLGTQFQDQQQKAQKLRDILHAVGIKTKSLDDHSLELRQQIQATTKAYDEQTAKLRALTEQRGKLFALNKRHSKEMIEVGMLAGAGVGAQAAGRNLARPVLSSVQTYAQQESASSQLSSSMMLANGQVSAEFRQINDLAMKLGDRLPGTTADFIEMMTMLRRQGLSAQSILGGTGEAAAYLGVQLKMPATAAAEFAAKMQDATRTTERDMMGLMDLIQRTYYLGVDSGNMLQGFTKLSPTLDVLKKQGLDAANSLAPLLVMMDQTGVAGEVSGNGIRKIIQAGLDAKKLGKANAALSSAKAGFQLNFVNEKGQFAGLENLFAQLQKLKGITSDVQRTSVLKELFGDDGDTLGVLNTMMDKGLTGYNEVVGKLQSQADLRKRVEAELGTISNLWESTTGTFTNVMAAMGQTVAPEVKDLTTWLGEVAGSTRALIAEHPVLVGWLVKILAVVAGLAFGLGTLSIALASVLGPFFVMRFVMSWLGLKFNLWAAAIRVVGTTLTWLRGVMVLLMAGNPVALAISAIVLAIAGAAVLIYKYWGPIQAFFAGVWTGLSDAVAPAITAISTALQPLRPVWDWLTGGLASAWTWFTQLLAPMQATTGQLLGISNAGQFVGQVLGNLVMAFVTLPAQFYKLGGDILYGLINGLTNGLGAVKAAIVGVADSTVRWFREKLGIRSPSRVFMAAGVNVGEGAAIGIDSTLALVRKAGAGIAAAAAIAMPAIAPPALANVQNSVQPAITALPKLVMPPLSSLAPANPGNEPLRIDSRPPMASAGAAQRQMPIIQGDTITIQIHPAPGMDPQALARAVSAELDKRDRAKAARRRSALGDIA